jgi:hypothetical protein
VQALQQEFQAEQLAALAGESPAPA